MAARVDYVKLAPEAVAAMRAVGRAVNTAPGSELVLLELVRLLASEMNGCHFCIDMHKAELKKLQEPEGRIANVLEWRGSEAYTQRERAAFAWTEAVTNIQEGHAGDAVYGQVRDHFSEVEIVNLTFAITTINAWNRVQIALADFPEHDGAVAKP